MATLKVRRLVRDDLSFAQKLRETAGWNQTRADWERLLSHEPEGCFLCELDGEPAGTATTTCHGGDVGWIGMVLVDPEYRRRGVATRLLDQCVSYLKERTGSIKLDATPDGMKVYERLGFVEDWRLHRWRCDSPRAPSSPPRLALPLEAKWLREMDREAFGADRLKFLHQLAAGSLATNFQKKEGFGMLRAGSHSQYLGPIVASSSEAGKSLVTSLLPADGPVIWDIPDTNQEAVNLAEALGFSKERLLIRMRLGEDNYRDDPTLQWAITGPETG